MQVIELLGVPGSPYTRKMLALLRYRRIPHRMVWGSHFEPHPAYPVPKVKLLPTFYFPVEGGTEAVVDSTPILYRLEAQYPGREVLPADPVLAFVAALIEDFADEWLTKAMFHYRWHHAEDAAHAGPLLVLWQNPQCPVAQLGPMSQAFAERQISRLGLVGSNPVTAPVIEASFERLVGILDRMIERHGFVLGSRPASADFALYGQLTQLVQVDPTPARWVAQHSPRLQAWMDRMEDLSGHAAGEWLVPTAWSDQLGELLSEVGRVYVPFLRANARAAASGHAEVQTTIDGQRWTQPVFPYQVKCLMALRQTHAALPPEAQRRLGALWAGTGCEALCE